MPRPGFKMRHRCSHTVTNYRRKGKVMYNTFQEAKAAMTQVTMDAVLTFDTLEIYACARGGHWHLGHRIRIRTEP